MKKSLLIISFIAAINSSAQNKIVIRAAGTTTATAVANPLTINAELSPTGATTYNGSAAKSIGIQPNSLTNAMLEGSIASAKLLKDAVYNVQSGTSYTIQSSDMGKVLDFTSSTAVAVTVPAGLPAGFNCLIRQLGNGAVTLSPGASVTITNRQGYTKTAGQYSATTLLQSSGNTYTTQGDMQ